ncbi:hypothetical protein D3C87_1776590 [compost metagenome]
MVLKAEEVGMAAEVAVSSPYRHRDAARIEGLQHRNAAPGCPRVIPCRYIGLRLCIGRSSSSVFVSHSGCRAQVVHQSLLEGREMLRVPMHQVGRYP